VLRNALGAVCLEQETKSSKDNMLPCFGWEEIHFLVAGLWGDGTAKKWVS
jgi:hypothetical protein